MNRRNSDERRGSIQPRPRNQEETKLEVEEPVNMHFMSEQLNQSMVSDALDSRQLSLNEIIMAFQ